MRSINWGLGLMGLEGDRLLTEVVGLMMGGMEGGTMPEESVMGVFLSL